MTDYLNWSSTGRDNQQPLVPIMPPLENSPPAAGVSSTAAGPSAISHQGERGEYPRLPTIPARSNPPSLRRSDRATRAPDRYEP